MQAEILAQKRRAILRVGLGQQVEVALPCRGGLGGLVDHAAHRFGQQRHQPHDEQRQREPAKQQPAGGGDRHAQRTAGQQGAEVRRVAAKQQVEHIDEGHRLTGCGKRRRQRRVGAEVCCPHQHGIDGQASDFHPAQVFERIDQAPAEHHAVEFERIVEQPADGQTDLFQPVAQDHHQRKAERQHQRKHEVIPRRAQHGTAAQAQRPKGPEAQCHEPDVEKAVHDDGRQRKADAAFHAAAGEHRAEHIAQMERQHKVEGIAASHAPQHLAAQRTLINTDELLPPQQAERMPHQDEKER